MNPLQSVNKSNTPRAVPSALPIMASSSSLHSFSSSQQEPTSGEQSKLQKVEIYNDLCNYEEVLQRLVVSVDKFSPDVKAARELIEVDSKLYSDLAKFPEFDSIDSELKKLDEESKEIDDRTCKILGILNDCYNELNALPMVEQVIFEMETMKKQKEKINSKLLLEYAMKLAKFTRIPPAFNKDVIRPNNFIWPAEDAIRRGMLAVASLKSKELTRIPGKEDLTVGIDSEEQEHEEESQVNDDIQNKKEKNVEDSQPNNGSFEFSAINTAKNEVSRDPESEGREDGDASIDLDLDLFNPDEFCPFRP
ncbi:HCL036Cp [Eremothecium sinecaudum]|uniref:Mediator of RNA polymerase II transcription subunit 4 n=1 Tax=Eremothecium sinecaudum TaxID=45286 RepID=A0A120K215_9SACH|nr:HCL036Cp [Eremothecium sinecaudum]AMD20115.1 HCL036Cp [Eremothecium sinecaudum]